MNKAERKQAEKFARSVHRHLNEAAAPLPAGGDLIKPMHEIIPKGGRNGIYIDHTFVDDKMAMAANVVNAVSHGPLERTVEPGTLTRLVIDGKLMMSDATFEKRTNAEVIQRAHGDVLIAGLGIGMILLPIVSKVDVRSVTVIEKYQEVIDLVEPHLRKALGEHSEKLCIMKEDILKFRLPKNFFLWDVIYFDIWPTVSDHNIPEIRKLKKLYKPFLKKTETSWIGAWMESQLERHFRNARRRINENMKKQGVITCPKDTRRQA